MFSKHKNIFLIFLAVAILIICYLATGYYYLSLTTKNSPYETSELTDPNPENFVLDDNIRLISYKMNNEAGEVEALARNLRNFPANIFLLQNLKSGLEGNNPLAILNGETQLAYIKRLTHIEEAFPSLLYLPFVNLPREEKNIANITFSMYKNELELADKYRLPLNLLGNKAKYSYNTRPDVLIHSTSYENKGKKLNIHVFNVNFSPLESEGENAKNMAILKWLYKTSEELNNKGDEIIMVGEFKLEASSYKKIFANNKNFIIKENEEVPEHFCIATKNIEIDRLENLAFEDSKGTKLNKALQVQFRVKK